MCLRTFNEERYLKQHIGGKKCEQRRAFLEKTSSFTLALSESPASIRNLSTASESDKVRISLLFSHFYWSSSSKNALILIIFRFLVDIAN